MFFRSHCTLLIIEEIAARLCLTRGDGGWTAEGNGRGRKRGRAEEVRQGTKEGKDGGNEAGLRKEEKSIGKDVFDKGHVIQHTLFEDNDSCQVVPTVSYLKRVNMVSPVIPQMGFSRLWLTHTVYETSGHLILESNYIAAACFATRPGRETEVYRGGGREGGRKRGMAEEVRQGRKEEARQRGLTRKRRREGARQGGGRDGRSFERS